MVYKKVCSKIALSFLSFLLLASGYSNEYVKLSKKDLADKIKGGWAGQIIGCTYGGPTEFKYRQTIIPDKVQISWNENSPITTTIFNGLYDDLYLDITFMDVLERYGLNAPVAEFQRAVGESNYELWAANRALRFAWLDGFRRGEHTSWKVNPSYNDIDFQIEADFAGLMSPAMPNTAVKFAETVGRSICSADGFYCGAYVAAMYALAFISDDMEYVVEEALKVLPGESRSRKMLSDIIAWHKDNPSDWKGTWQKFEDAYVKKRDNNLGGIYIHAPYNCAYIIIGLLYGKGDFEKTMDISTRCGLDSDCNPASACGILGTAIGYSKIPVKFRKPLELSQDKTFLGTNYSPEKLYSIGVKQALEVLKVNGAKFEDDGIYIQKQALSELPLEANAPSSEEVSFKNIHVKFSDKAVLNFEGNGAILIPDKGFLDAFKKFAGEQQDKGFAGEMEIMLDDRKIRTAKFFTEGYRMERDFIFSERDIESGTHKIELRLVNTKEKFPEFSGNLKVFSNNNQK